MSKLETFAAEHMTVIWPQVEPLARVHYAEVGISKSPLRWAREHYAAMEDAGTHRFYTVRDDHRNLIAYCSMILVISPHDQVREAHEDAIYVLPEFRGNLGPSFERRIDYALSEDGVRRIFRERIITGEPERATRRGPIGYEPQSVLWRRDLGD